MKYRRYFIIENLYNKSNLDISLQLSIFFTNDIVITPYFYSRIVWLKHLGNCVNQNKRNIYIYNYCSYNDVVSN